MNMYVTPRTITTVTDALVTLNASVSNGIK